MSRKVTIRFNSCQTWRGQFPDGLHASFVPKSCATEYSVTIEPCGDDHCGDVHLTMLDGVRMRFYAPGISTSYSVVREGWGEVQTCFPAVNPPCKPILESTLIMTIEPSQHNSSLTNMEYLIYKLPRVLNGLLVDRGHIDQETVADRANPECVGELKGVASFMLVSRNNHLRYRCVSFRIDNKTTKKNLTSQYGCASVRPS